MATLLRHGYEPFTDEREYLALIEDWINAIGRFPQFAIEQACNDFLASETRRVMPAHIVQRCVAIMADVRGEVSRVRARIEEQNAPPREEPTPEAKARVGALVKQFRRDTRGPDPRTKG